MIFSRHHALLLALFLACLPGQSFCADETRKDDKGTYLGALFGPRKDTSLPAPKNRGAIITHVLTGSPAAKADLRRNDVVLEYDGKTVRDHNHLAQLIQADKPDRKVTLGIQRGGKLQAISVTLALGPALRLANDDADQSPAKPGGVTLRATPLESGKVQLSIEYGVGTDRKVVTCNGAAEDLAATLKKLPERERQLVRIALERLRALETPKKTKKE